jgi:hypothetical protein
MGGKKSLFLQADVGYALRIETINEGTEGYASYLRRREGRIIMKLADYHDELEARAGHFRLISQDWTNKPLLELELADD